MRAIFILVLLCGYGSCLADSAWWSSNIREADCTDLQRAGDRERCLGEYNNQKLVRLTHYLKQRISSIQSDSCDNDQILMHVENGRKKWDEYSHEVCAMQSHCIGPCGSGHSAVYDQCFSSKRFEYLERLERQVKTGTEIWGCSIKGTLTGQTLVTERFTVDVYSNCQNGLLECDVIEYQGVNKKTKDRIELTGQPFYLTTDMYDGLLVPDGYVFKNGNIEYRVFHRGVLRVINTETDEVLLEEAGYWR